MQLLLPPSQLFRALELPEQFVESISLRVPVPVRTGGNFVITVGVMLMDTVCGEYWQGRVIDAEPCVDPAEFTVLWEHTQNLIETARIQRLAEVEAVQLLPSIPAVPSQEDERSAVRRVAQELASGDQGLLEILLGHMAPSVRLLTRNASECRSRFGGVPFLPPGEDWPRRKFGRPLFFLAQLDLREVPRISLTEPLPTDGMLSFFYDADHMCGLDSDCFKVLFSPPNVDLAPTQPPADTPEDFVRPTAGIRFVSDATVNVYELSLNDDQQVAILERGNEYGPAYRLLGEPEAIQGNPREEIPSGAKADDWQLLLQVDSGEPLYFDFGDSGRLYFLMRKQDLKEHRWERAWLVMQCY